MTRVTGPWLWHTATQNVAATLSLGGHQVFFVGGCVRNELLDAPVSDIDMATDARPERVTELCTAQGLRVVPTGLAHGTVTVVAGGIAHEITTFRRDVATDGRHADIAYSKTLEDDAVRRDFTMNALYADPRGAVIDPVGGLPDLRARRVRFINDASQRILEDHLRILRFFRFHAWYGDPMAGIDPEGLAACAAGAEGLSKLSRERVGSEMVKLLTAPDPAPAIAAMAQAGLLSRIMPGSDPKALAPLVHLEAHHPVRWHRRAAAIGGENLPDRWRLSRSDATRLERLRELLQSGISLGEIAFRDGADMAWDSALIRAAVFETPVDAGTTDIIATAAAAVFPVTAADLMGRFEGAALGAELRRIEREWIASSFTLSKETLLG